MAINLNEEATLTLKANTRDIANEIAVLDTRAQTLKNTLKEIEKTGAGKGSEEWKKYRAELTQVNAELAKTRKETDLTKLTYGQLGNLVQALNKDLKALVPGTQAFVDATKRLNDAKTRLADVGKQVNNINTESTALGQPTRWQRITSGVGTMTNAFRAFMALQVISYIVSGFTAIISKFMQFEDAAQDLSAITGLTGKDLEYLKDQAKKTGPQFGMTAAEMLDAYKLMASAKPELLAQKELLAATTNEAIILAKAGKIDLTSAAKVTAESLNQWGLKADQARRFVNVMAAGAKEGAAEISDMSSALKASGTVAASTNLSFEQTNAVLQSMSGIALKGEQAGTMLRNVLVKLQSGAADTNPKIVGLDKALANLGKQNLSTAELAKKFGTENLIAAQHIITHREEIGSLTTKMTGTNTAYDQAKTNMNTLSESWKKGTAIVTGLAVTIGEKLAPYVKQAIEFFVEMAENIEVNSGVFDTFSGILGDVWDVFKTLVSLIFPRFTAGATTIRGVMQGVAVVFQTILVPIRLFTASLVALLEAFHAVGSGAKGLVLFLKGDFIGAGQAFEETRQHGVKIKETFSKAFTDIGNGYKRAFADKPKEVLPAAVKANQETSAAVEGAITKENDKGLKEREKQAEKARKKEQADHKKQLEDVGKANQKAIEDLHKLEADAHIASIQDEQKRELTKILAKHDLAVEEIMRGIQDEKLKNQQIAFLDAQLQGEVTKLNADHAEKRRKKSEDEEKARLETQKNILEQERLAENALLDWKEINAKGNAVKLAAIHQERLTINYRATVEKLNAEEASEKAKATREIADKEQLDRAITAIEARYDNEQLLATAKNAQEKAKIEEELRAKKKAIWGDVSSAFGALLKGDMSAFLDHADKLVKGEKSAMQKKLQANQETYAAIGAMASQAVQFLADLAKAKADKAIAQIQRERDANVAALNSKVAEEQAAIDKIESDKQRIKSESDAKIEMLRTTSEQTISNLENQYRQLSSSEEKAKLNDQLQGYRDNADGKTEAARQAAEDAIEAAQLEAKETIDAAQKTEAAAIKSANNEKEQKIDAAEATRDAEIASINKRTDIDQATRKTLLAEAKAAFDLAKRQATEEADHKIVEAKAEAKTKTDLAKATQKTKTELANDQRDAELKAITAIKNGDDKAAKEILARAKSDAKEKIALAKDEATKKIDEAEREKREKLKKVEAEKATRIANQKDLNRAIEQEQARAKTKEAAEKRKAWEAQKKADTTSALITGALSVIKALASGFWPVNLVFAAMAAVMTGVQVAKIRSQPAPQFRDGGSFIPEGGRHGSTYGSGGMAIVDRQTGREQGEMEGGEAIISREQTRANLPIIHRMFANARTPGRRSTPVDRDVMGRPAGFRDGGVFSGLSGSMYVYGGVIPKPRRRYDDGGIMDDAGGDSSGGVSDGSDGIGAANDDYEESKKQFGQQIKALEEIKAAVVQANADNRASLNALAWGLSNQNAQLRTDLMGAIGTMSKDVQQTITTTSTGLRTSLALLVLRQQTDNKEVVAALQLGFGLLQRSQDSATKSSANSMAMLALNMNVGMMRLSDNMTAGLTQLRLSTALELRQSASRGEVAMSNLGSLMYWGMTDLASRTERSQAMVAEVTRTGLRQSADRMAGATDNMANEVRGLRWSINAVEGAVWANRQATQSVEGAIWGSNQQGRLDALIATMSVFGKK
ncbi:phage tail tape measure protein [Fibrella aquatica]|uniref:phage tail tape measure protein n=1 Tax=Fibrella aquatica TaxID=3242487 RepID=UPI003522804B